MEYPRPIGASGSMFDGGGRPELKRMCRHCASLDAAKLGTCVVCGLSVCEKCGNVQHTRGERRVIHDSCLRDDEDGFQMIKFVK